MRDSACHADVSRRTCLALSIGSVTASFGRGAFSADADRVPIIDSHVHFYDPTRPEGVPWPAKHDRTLHRPVLPDEWERLASPLGPSGAIVVEASPWVEDNQWLLDLAERHDAVRGDGMLGIVGVVGSLPLEDASSAALIDRFARHRRFRGIRVNGSRLLAGLDDTGYTARLTRVVDHGLTLDVNGGTSFEAADAVAARFPRLHVVLDHMGNTRIASDGPPTAWLAAIEKVARRPNVFMKVSALAESAAHAMKQPKPPLDTAFYEPWLDAAWKAFGEQRLLFGTNWPVSDRAASYADVFGIVAPFVRARGPGAERRFFAGTSRVAYGLATATNPRGSDAGR
jgi:L-fuconolactonase